MTQAKLRDLVIFGKSGALCSLLIRLGNTYGIDLGSSTFIDRRFSHAELAEMIATTRESVSRMLGDLKNKDVIVYLDGHIMIN
ncbi:helix-turn-helix domain-containing protein [Paenibacillus aestuarii]|uniref:Helix-turn-helix domain-containing protein n=1 Tax=Paenibacillus aestuarii TaxID=516965 RepID=A0ABW0K3Z6_9BACL|nr:helix-turn-helix domain-containing protein [Paenibacillus aestuarii]